MAIRQTEIQNLEFSGKESFWEKIFEVLREKFLKEKLRPTSSTHFFLMAAM